MNVRSFVWGYSCFCSDSLSMFSNLFFVHVIHFFHSVDTVFSFLQLDSFLHPNLTLSYLILSYLTLPSFTSLSLFFSFYYCLLSHLFFLLPTLPIYDAAYYRSREEWNVLIEGCGFKRGTYGITEWGDRRLLTTHLLSTPTFPLGFCFHCLFFTLSASSLLLYLIIFLFLYLFILFICFLLDLFLFPRLFFPLLNCLAPLLLWGLFLLTNIYRS